MKRFRFSLETLLRHRQSVEDRERNTLLQLRAGLQRERDHRGQLEQRGDETRLEMAASTSADGTVNTGELQVSSRYLRRLGLEIRRSEERLRALTKDVQSQTAVVIEAAKKTKVLDTLKGKRLKEHLQDAETTEQKAVDDIVVTRFVSKEP
jgi:flagellar export protein FliJ